MCDGAMTDPKGDRSLAPSKQADPDQFLHVVERREDGVIVRGAKAHQTGAVNSHEVIVMPTVAMGPDDADYALAFAVPMDTPGIICIFGRQSNDSRKEEGILDQGNTCFGAVGGEALLVFDDVFVPWERVFMCGEYEFAGLLVERFASYHRQNYGGCKAGVADVLIGACATLAAYQGTAQGEPHQGQADGDGSPGRDHVLLLSGLFVRGCSQRLGPILRRPPAGQCDEAERDPQRLRGGAPGPRHRRRGDRHPALGAGSRQPRDRQVCGEVLPGRRRRAGQGPHPHRPAHRGHEQRHRLGRIDARRRVASGHEGHNPAPGEFGAEDAVGHGSRGDHGVRGDGGGQGRRAGQGRRRRSAPPRRPRPRAEHTGSWTQSSSSARAGPR